MAVIVAIRIAFPYSISDAGSGPPPSRVPPIKTNMNANGDDASISPRGQTNPSPSSAKGHIKQNSGKKTQYLT